MQGRSPIQRPPFLPSPTFAGSSDPAIWILFAGKEALSELDGLLLLFGDLLCCYERSKSNLCSGGWFDMRPPVRFIAGLFCCALEY